MSVPTVPADTSSDVLRRQVAAWRSLGDVGRLELAARMSAEVTELAVTSIRRTLPEATPDDLRHELARRRYGSSLADAAYGPRRSG